MNKLSVLFVMVLMVFGVMLGVTNAHAFGIGLYIEHAAGSGSFDDSYNYYDDSVDVDALGFGLVFDTNLSKESVFNYRFSIGYNTLELPNDNIDAYRISLDNTFGFGIIKKESFRLWVGPQLHLSYSNWDVPIGGSYINKDSVDLIGWGLGVVLGANINLPAVGSICPEIGVRYQGNISDTYSQSCYGYGCPSDYNYGEDYSYTETVIFAKISFMFGGYDR